MHPDHLTTLERDMDQRFAARPAGDEPPGGKATRAHSVSDSDPVERLHRIRGQPEPGPDRVEPLRLLEHDGLDPDPL